MENLSIFEASQGARRRFEFRSEDITKFTTWKVTPEPTLLMCHATLFDNDLFACVQLMSEECETGTMFIMVSRETAKNATFARLLYKPAQRAIREPVTLKDRFGKRHSRASCSKRPAQNAPFASRLR